MIPGCWPIFKREARAYFQSPSTWVVLGLLFLTTSAIFHQIVIIYAEQSREAASQGPLASAAAPNLTIDVIQNVFNVMAAMILFTIPILSMRLVASERASGTFEVLVTCPVSDWGILLGKYFALLSVGVAIVVLGQIYPISAWWIGREAGAKPEWPIVASSALGLFMIFAAYSAFGLMASSFTASQVTASVITLVGLLLWNTIGEFKIPSHGARQTLMEISALNHTQNFIAGLVSLRDILFFVLASFFCLFIAARALEARRWRI